ncbi:hypothetical protein BCR41DRAFT_367130 [Lobosporangium transversale]|uniref:Uncharacterized protein n=1 Tax=Lobosporangium transversale TaxID=64571 RepID=A0A1Y2H1T5_9FUNG|nr:hypothetical protein BCR41DRAFT_367130 [Lobosporangium transversale]ORZ28495.1 hypothetical protein BCR41DRAFT_367130 [Lobosporangium transversale]|eukprot:XP_021886180.1 hypothetical protein BCR41DRAFT_367130 [Lobosporangium transversale]
MAQQFQDVQLDDVVKKVRIREGGDGRSYVLVEDIRDAFLYFGDKFELHGKPVPFLENGFHERLYPERIASYPTEVLTVVPVLPAPSEPSSAALSSSLQITAVHPPLSSCSIPPFLSSDVARQESLHTLLDSQTKKLMNVLDTMQAQVDRLERNAQISEGKLAEILAAQKNIAETQDKLMVKMDTMIANTEALLTQTYELHEYTLPRLFIVLPEVAYHGINPAQILSKYAAVKFRLYFLCECGTHTNPTGPHHMNHIHTARHEGYEIKHPTAFFQKYGPHALRLLHALKLGLNLANGVIPALSTINLIDLPAQLGKDLESRVSASIQYLTAYQRTMDPSLSGMTRTDRSTTCQSRAAPASSSMMGELECPPSPLDAIVEVEGADLRRLNAYLEKKDQDRALGNLFRTVDARGHVKWICLDHFRSTYHQRRDREFENEILMHRGQYDRRLGIVTVVLPSSEAITRFMDAMTQAGSFNELDVQLRSYGCQDLKILGDSLSKTNVSKLILTAHQYKGISSLCKKKLPPVLEIMAAGKVRYFEFKDIKDLIPPRGVQIPKTMSGVRSLELTGISVKEGHEVLGEMLQAFKHLAVFHLEETKLKETRLKSVLNGLSSCQDLQVLSFRNCEIQSESAETIAEFLKTCLTLKELDLSQNEFDDVGCCEIIQAVGSQLTKLLLNDTGFGDEAAMALERVVSGKLLKILDISDSSNKLGPDATECIIRLGGRLHCVELAFPRIQSSADEVCARIVQALDASKLERLVIEGNDCGDHTAAALAQMLSDPARPCAALTTFKINLPKVTHAGAIVLATALPQGCQTVKISLRSPHLFLEDMPKTTAVKSLFTAVCARVTYLTLSQVEMSDDEALLLCDAIQSTDILCRLEYLDISRNRMTPAGAAMVLGTPS